MKIKTFDSPEKWDAFVLESRDCWFWHHKYFIDYTLEYTKNAENLSFYIEDGSGEILAIVPLIKENTSFSFSGSYVPNIAFNNFISDDLKSKILLDCMKEIDSLALKHRIKECKMSLSTLSQNHLPPNITYNWLMKYGFENTSLNTQILDLTKDEKTLWNEIKKSHRCEIKKNENEKLFKVLLVDEYNVIEHFYGYQQLHELASGRKTRSQTTWDLQNKWLKEGKAVLALAYKDSDLIGGIYTNLYKNCAYYGLAASHPDFESLSIGHYLQWEMIKWLKNHRFTTYELGTQFFKGQKYDNPTDKEIEISKFKRHFGGKTISLYRGIKTW